MTLHITDFVFDRNLCVPDYSPALTARWELCPRKGQRVCRWESTPRPLEVFVQPAMDRAERAAEQASDQLADLLRRHRELRAA